MKSRCPGEETLADYLSGRLPLPAKKQVEAHLLECETCLETLGLLNQTEVQADPVPQWLTAAAVRQVQALQSHRPPGMRERAKALGQKASDWLCRNLTGGGPAVAVRGEGGAPELFRVKKRFARLAVWIEVEKEGLETARIRVILEEEPPSVRITLKREQREISSQPPEAGYALFEAIPFGHYRLEFSQAGEPIGSYGFAITDSQRG